MERIGLIETDLIDGAVLRPSFAINFGGNAMCRRAGGHHIEDEAFVISVYREVHFPAIGGAPMPEQDVLPAVAIPVKIDAAPELVDTGCQFFFFGVPILEILSNAEQTLQQIAGLYEITAVVVPAEGFHMAGGVIQPVGPCAMKPICFFEKGNDLFEPCESLPARNKVS